jgi:hypothetical protein
LCERRVAGSEFSGTITLNIFYRTLEDLDGKKGAGPRDQQVPGRRESAGMMVLNVEYWEELVMLKNSMSRSRMMESLRAGSKLDFTWFGPTFMEISEIGHLIYHYAT